MLPLIRFPFISKYELQALGSTKKALLQYLPVGQALIREAYIFQLAEKEERSKLTPRKHPVHSFPAGSPEEEEVNWRRKKQRMSKHCSTQIPEINDEHVHLLMFETGKT
mmetsp:Transcript_37069/g.48813  ORF Transcript_37069/g.48813 Transcript_37069/m.48813 type:complete len:109 (-) Transcript_37069:175-501(-)